ncbi:MAG: MgtC/SapB family protein [Bacillota bacterium]
MGVLMGWQRTKQKKPAGIRTHALAAVTGCYIMLISAYGFSDFPGVKDPARLAAQFVTGIGFLGAGVIWKMESGNIRGLTTAVIVYITAMFGLGLGLGEYMPTFIAVGVAVIAMNLTPLLVKLKVIEYDDEAARKNDIE